MKTEIEKFDPCNEALEFRKQFATFKEAWEQCPRGDWMLWIAAKLNVDKRRLFLAKGLCAQTVIRLMTDERSVNAVNAAIAYGKGEISKEQLKKAYDDAGDASYDAYYTAAHSAYAYAAAATATAASYAASYAAAAYAAYVAAAAAAYAADAAKKDNQKQTADICREILTDEVLTKISQL